MNAWLNYTATLKILVFGLLVGAALPALFAAGVRVGAAGDAAEAGVSSPGTHRRPVLITLSWGIYALVAIIVVVGVLFIARDFIGHHLGCYILGAHPT